ncbi:MAG: hypothetical protein M3256_26870 [Actinomycetota bacterium]|nr:hypothetical protein [Actinomycetota bacterium]
MARAPAALRPAQAYLGRLLALGDRVGPRIAGILVALLALLALSSGLVVMAYPEREPAIESFPTLVFAPIIGLVGSVIGFYFGSRRPDGTG